jgi:hypothetical protein
MNEKNVATGRDWATIMGSGIVLVIIGIVVGFFSSRLPVFRQPFDLSGRSVTDSLPDGYPIPSDDLAGDWIEIGVAEPLWESQVAAALPAIGDGERDILFVVSDPNGALRYMLARFHPALVPLSIHFHLVNVTVIDRDTVEAVYVGELTGRFIHWSRGGRCWVEATYSQRVAPTDGCMTE